MADVVVDSAVATTGAQPQAGSSSFMAVDVSSTVLYIFYKDSNGDLVYNKSTDAGATWGGAVVVAATATSAWSAPSVWYDRWTSGNSGTKIHIAWFDEGTDRVIYRNLETSTDTLSSAVSTDPGLALGNDPSNVTRVCIDRGGYIYNSYNGWNGSAATEGFMRSTNAGVSFTTRAHPWANDDNEGAASVLMPGNYADPHDMDFLYTPQPGVVQTGLRVYDDSANSWSSVTVFSGADLLTEDARQVAAAIRHSDGHMIAVILTEVNNAASDIEVWDINGAGSITQKTNIITNDVGFGAVGVYIDQNTNDIYVAILGESGSGWNTSVPTQYTKSTNGGTTWGTLVKYNQNANGNNLAMWASHGSPGVNPGLFGIWWLDNANSDIYFNAANAIQIAGTAFAVVTGTITANIREADIVAGGKTLILTLTNDTWVTAGGTFDGQRQNIINGLDSAQSEGGGWDAIVKAGLAVTDVVRTSNTVVTVTLPAFASYATTLNEVITATIPSTALTGATQVVATPTIGIETDPLPYNYFRNKR